MPKYKKTSSPAVNVTENANLAPAVNVTHLISRYGVCMEMVFDPSVTFIL